MKIYKNNCIKLIMGEIIIKVPEDIHETITITNEENLEELNQIFEVLKNKLFLRKNMDKFLGKFEIEEVSDEELHLQGD